MVVRKVTTAAFRTFALSLIVAAYIVGCASKPQSVNIPLTSNPVEEIKTFDRDLAEARAKQTNVLSPYNFEKAEELGAKARKQREAGKENETVFETLGLARGYLNAANSISSSVAADIPEVVAARQDAVTGGALETEKTQMTHLDERLSYATKSAERGELKISQNERAELQKRYIDVELDAIKNARLAPAKALIESARKDNAVRLSPKTLEAAEMKVKAAETVIEAERHNEAAISKASNEATAEARRLVQINDFARGAKARTPEEIALEMEREQKYSDRLGVALTETAQNLRATEQSVAEKNRAIAGAQAEKSQLEKQAAELQKEKEFNAAIEKARQEFDPNVAEVYRQGDQLIIRLKSMNFKPGQAALSSDSMGALGKVRDVITQLGGAENIKIEGHTDSTGSAKANKALSEERAKSVASFLVNQRVVPEGNVEATGAGYERPIASNKTKEGRAQNRRVDIIVTPNSTIE